MQCAHVFEYGPKLGEKCNMLCILELYKKGWTLCLKCSDYLTMNGKDIHTFIIETFDGDERIWNPSSEFQKLLDDCKIIYYLNKCKTCGVMGTDIEFHLSILGLHYCKKCRNRKGHYAYVCENVKICGLEDNLPPEILEVYGKFGFPETTKVKSALWDKNNCA